VAKVKVYFKNREDKRRKSQSIL